MQYVVVGHNKWVNLATIISKLDDVDLSSKELLEPTGTVTRAPTEITKKIYESELEKHLDRADILETT